MKSLRLQDELTRKRAHLAEKIYAMLSNPERLPTTVSPLMLADRILALAADADRAGLRRPAEKLLKLAYAVYDEKPARA